MMNYDTYDFIGMHLLWWVLWILLLVWIFATPYHIPGQRAKKETPLEILKRRFALGEIDGRDYDRMKDILSK